MMAGEQASTQRVRPRHRRRRHAPIARAHHLLGVAWRHNKPPSSKQGRAPERSRSVTPICLLKTISWIECSRDRPVGLPRSSFLLQCQCAPPSPKFGEWARFAVRRPREDSRGLLPGWPLGLLAEDAPSWGFRLERLSRTGKAGPARGRAQQSVPLAGSKACEPTRPSGPTRGRRTDPSGPPRVKCDFSGFLCRRWLSKRELQRLDDCWGHCLQ